MPNAINLTGQRFDKLVVIKRAENDKYGKSRWICKCDCGNEKVVNSRELNRGDTTSCGCKYYESNKANNLINQRFGRLVVIKRVQNLGNKVAWECLCNCGKLKIVTSSSLCSGSTLSCGCLRKETSSKKATIHGHYHERLHGVWNSMRQRCINPNNKDYPFYGGRGINVCKEWVAYSSFRQWALSAGYKEKLTIERINVDGDYYPDNCKWIPLKEQMVNRRSNLSYKKAGAAE